MNMRESYVLAYRLVRMDLAGRMDRRTARALLDSLPVKVHIAALESRGNMPTGILYKWLSFERFLSFSSGRLARVIMRAAARTGTAA